MANCIYYKGTKYASTDDILFKKISQEEYINLDIHEDNTIYYVVDNNGAIKQYFGDTEISSSLSPAPAVVYCAPAPRTELAQADTTVIDLSNPELWEQGGINEDGSNWETGNIASAIYIRTLIPIKPTETGLIFTSEIVDGKEMMYAAVCYDENKQVVESGMYNWFNNGTRKVLNDNVRYIQIETRTADWSTFTPEELISAKLTILED